jgi:hypothetical protein
VDERPRGTIRYETAVATLVGVCALLVSAYTAYVQRQQVRAQVWPILEYSTSNEPFLRLTIANKGVGPALIRHVVVTVDEKPAASWREALQLLLGPGPHFFAQSTIHNRVFSAGESVDVLTPRDAAGATLPHGGPFDAGRQRIGIEICYCSTLGDCWTMVSRPGAPAGNAETRRCPEPTERSFQQ